MRRRLSFLDGTGLPSTGLELFVRAMKMGPSILAGACTMALLIGERVGVLDFDHMPSAGCVNHERLLG